VVAHVTGTNGTTYDSSPVSFVVCTVDPCSVASSTNGGVSATNGTSTIKGRTYVPTGGASASGSGGSSSPSAVSISITPSVRYMASAGTATFNAIVSNAPQGVRWAALLGRIDPNGNYTAPVVGVDPTDVITATSIADPLVSASVDVGVSPVAVFDNLTTDSNVGMTSFAFTGTAGEVVNFTMTGIDLSGTSCYNAGILTQEGVQIAGDDCVASSSISFDNLILPSDGVYTAFLDSGTGSATTTFALSNPATGTIAFGASTTMSTSFPGKTESLSFSGTAGQTVSLFFDNGSSDTYPWTHDPAELGIEDASGNILVEGCPGFYDGPTITSGLPLPSDGTYTVFLDPGNATGSVNVFLNTFTTTTGTIAFNTTTTISNTLPNQTKNLTFNGTAGQTVTLTFDNGSSDTYPWLHDVATLGIKDASGNILASSTPGWLNDPTITNGLTLPADGTYSVFLDPGVDTGSVNVMLHNYVNTTATGGTIPFNTSTTINTTILGQMTAFTFNGTFGQTVILTFDDGSSDTYPSQGAALSIENASGTPLVSNYAGRGDNGGVITSGYSLPADGTYTVLFDPGSATGTVTVNLQNLVNITGTMPFNTPTIISNTLPGQNVYLTFTGTAGQIVSLSFNSDPGVDSYPWIRSSDVLGIENASGTVLAEGDPGYFDGPVIAPRLVLSADGTYTVFLNSNGATGSVPVTLATFTDITGTIPFNTTTTMSNSYLGQATNLTFTGTAGQNVALTFDDGSSDTYSWMQGGPSLSLEDASGTVFATVDVGQGQSNGTVTSGYPLPADGTYSVFLNPANAFSGTVNVNLQSL